MEKRKVNQLEYQENLLVRMLENGGKINLRCDKLPTWVSQMEGKYIELEENASHGDNYLFCLTNQGYKFANRLNR